MVKLVKEKPYTIEDSELYGKWFKLWVLYVKLITPISHFNKFILKPSNLHETKK